MASGEGVTVMELEEDEREVGNAHGLGRATERHHLSTNSPQPLTDKVRWYSYRVILMEKNVVECPPPSAAATQTPCDTGPSGQVRRYVAVLLLWSASVRGQAALPKVVEQMLSRMFG